MICNINGRFNGFYEIVLGTALLMTVFLEVLLRHIFNHKFLTKRTFTTPSHFAILAHGNGLQNEPAGFQDGRKKAGDFGMDSIFKFLF
jgi:hypothetical protein